MALRRTRRWRWRTPPRHFPMPPNKMYWRHVFPCFASTKIASWGGASGSGNFFSSPLSSFHADRVALVLRPYCTRAFCHSFHLVLNHSPGTKSGDVGRWDTNDARSCETRATRSRVMPPCIPVVSTSWNSWTFLCTPSLFPCLQAARSASSSGAGAFVTVRIMRWQIRRVNNYLFKQNCKNSRQLSLNPFVEMLLGFLLLLPNPTDLFETLLQTCRHVEKQIVAHTMAIPSISLRHEDFRNLPSNLNQIWNHRASSSGRENFWKLVFNTYGVTSLTGACGKSKWFAAQKYPKYQVWTISLFHNNPNYISRYTLRYST